MRSSLIFIFICNNVLFSDLLNSDNGTLASSKAVKDKRKLFFGDESNRIDVQLSEEPWIVTIMNRKRVHLCSGVIISNWHIFTACQCVSRLNFLWHDALNVGEFKVAAGIVDTRTVRGKEASEHRQVRNIIESSIHPECRLDEVVHRPIYDIAFLITEFPFVITEFVKPAQLPFYAEGHKFSNEVALIVDSGDTFEIQCQWLVWYKRKTTTGKIWYKLNDFSVSIMGISKCKHTLTNLPGYGHWPDCSLCLICTDPTDYIKCEDPIVSSPIFCGGILFGLTSWDKINDSTCSNKVPTVYTRIDSLMEWIVYALTSGQPFINRFQFDALLLFLITLFTMNLV